MPSIDAGKDVVCNWIRNHFPKDSTILDVGACDGKWRTLLPEYPNMDAVEVWRPNVAQIEGKYRRIYATDIRKLNYYFYDLIIFGDVIEHMNVEDAQMVLRTAKGKCYDMIVAVPFLYPQGEIYGNPYERHVQADLTPQIFHERYEGFDVLHDTHMGYCYYHRRQK